MNNTVWTGRIVNGFIILFLLADAIPKIRKIDVAVDGSADLGYPESTSKAADSHAIWKNNMLPLTERSVAQALCLPRSE